MTADPEHEHGGAPYFLPHWMQERWTVLTVAVAGVALVVCPPMNQPAKRLDFFERYLSL